jgi:YaiO family outer membrane protein
MGIKPALQELPDLPSVTPHDKTRRNPLQSAFLWKKFPIRQSEDLWVPYREKVHPPRGAARLWKDSGLIVISAALQVLSIIYDRIRTPSASILTLSAALILLPESGSAQAEETDRTQKKNRVLLEYLGDRFDKNFSDWALFSAGLQRKEKPLSLIARINFAERFDQTGTELELELYPKLGRKSYAFLNVAGSGSDIFPEMRYGGEFYQGLPKGFEISLGSRYFLFPTTKALIYTGSISKYLGNFLLSAKPFVNPRANRAGTTLLLLLRYYLKDTDNYISLNFVYGLSPDDPSNQKWLDAPQYLKSTKVFADFRKEILSGKLIAKGLLSYENREYIPGSFLNQYSLMTGIEIPF